MSACWRRVFHFWQNDRNLQVTWYLELSPMIISYLVPVGLHGTWYTQYSFSVWTPVYGWHRPTPKKMFHVHPVWLAWDCKTSQTVPIERI